MEYMSLEFQERSQRLIRRLEELAARIQLAREVTQHTLAPSKRAVLDPLYEEAAEVQVELLELILEIFDSRRNSLRGAHVEAKESVIDYKGGEYIFDAMRYLMPDWLKKAQSVGRDERKPYAPGGVVREPVMRETINENYKSTNMGQNENSCNAGVGTTPYKNRLEYYLKTFEHIVKPLYFAGDNVVIGGTMALELHGLKLGRQVGDLDFIIYRPTEEQLKIIDQISGFRIQNVADEYNEKQEDKAGLKKPRSYKFKSGEIFLNILIEEYDHRPVSGLLYQHENRIYVIQNIDNVLAAKKKYCTGDKLSRTKDVEDFKNWKNLNFNL